MRKLLTILLLLCSHFVIGQQLVASSFNNTITNNSTYSPFQATEGSMSYSLQRDNTYARIGTYSMRFELRNTDPTVPFGSNRTEITIFNNYNQASQQNLLARWYRASTRINAANWASDIREEVVWQFHDKSSGCSASPTLSLEIKNNRYYIRTRYSTADYCTTSNRVERPAVDLGPVTFDTWTDWVIYLDPKTDNTGTIRVWKNGSEVYTLTNAPTHYAGAFPMPYWKIGIYKWFWANSNDGGSTSTLRIIRFDEVAVYGSSSTLADVQLPSGGGNQSPIVSAGNPQSLPIGTISTNLTGTASDPEGSINTTSWQWISGPNTPTIQNAGSLSTAVNNMIAGTYLFRLVAFDNLGAQSSADVTVTIAAPPVNNPPTVDVSDNPSEIPYATSMQLKSQGVDPDGGPVTYEWEQLDGLGAFISTPSANNTIVSGLLPGEYLFKVTVTDNLGATTSKEVSIKVRHYATPISSGTQYFRLKKP